MKMPPELVKQLSDAAEALDKFHTVAFCEIPDPADMGCWEWLEHLEDVRLTLEGVQTESHMVFKPGTRVALAPPAQGGEFVYREGTVLVRGRGNRAPKNYVHVHWDGNLITHTAMLPPELLKELDP